MDAGYNRWKHQGLKYIAQMLRGQTLKSFQQSEQEFNLPAHDFYKFLQLRHYLKTHKEWENICKTPSKLEELLMAYTEGETKKGAISKLYKVLQQESNDKNLDVKEKWELEANIIITDNGTMGRNIQSRT